MYRHTQIGTLVLVVLALVVAHGGVMTWLLYESDPAIAWIAGGGGVLFVALMLLFGALTVSVDSRELRLRFGIGIVGKRFPLREIRAARTVRNRWYYGWGVRLTPHGWLYNIAGLDAVEIELAQRRVRIGTDEPHALLEAIERGRKQSQSPS